MSQEFDVLTGKLNGLIAALSVIAAALPKTTAADVQETLRELAQETATADLPVTALSAMHATIAQIVDSMEIGLHR